MFLKIYPLNFNPGLLKHLGTKVLVVSENGASRNRCRRGKKRLQ
jgi:hypothetical protein